MIELSLPAESPHPEVIMQRSTPALRSLKLFTIFILAARVAVATDCQEYEGGMRFVSSLSFSSSSSSDVAFHDHYAYAAMEKIKVIDIANPAEPLFIREVSAGWAQPLGIDAEAGILVGAINHGGLEIYSLADPEDPELLARSPLAYRCYGVDLVGTIAYCASIEHGLVVLDLSDPSEPEQIGQAPGVFIRVHHQAGYLYVTQDLMNDRSLNVYDVSNPANPLLTFEWGTDVRDAVPVGNRLYVGHGLGGGLSLHSLVDPAQPSYQGLTEIEGFVRSGTGFDDFAFGLLSNIGDMIAGKWCEAGEHQMAWDGKAENGAELPSGIYILQLVAGAHKAAEKLTLLR